MKDSSSVLRLPRNDKEKSTKRQKPFALHLSPFTFNFPPFPFHLGLKPLLETEIPDGEARTKDHEGDGEEIADGHDPPVGQGEMPVELGHVLEIHAVDRLSLIRN